MPAGGSRRPAALSQPPTAALPPRARPVGHEAARPPERSRSRGRAPAPADVAPVSLRLDRRDVRRFHERDGRGLHDRKGNPGRRSPPPAPPTRAARSASPVLARQRVLNHVHNERVVAARRAGCRRDRRTAGKAQHHPQAPRAEDEQTISSSEYSYSSTSRSTSLSRPGALGRGAAAPATATAAAAADVGSLAGAAAPSAPKERRRAVLCAAMARQDERRDWHGPLWGSWDRKDPAAWQRDWRGDWEAPTWRGGGDHRCGGAYEGKGGERRSWHGRGGGAGGSSAEGGISRIHVANLPRNTTEDSMRSMFQQFGKVLGVKILTARGSGTVSGIIRFGTPAAAEAAIASLHGAPARGGIGALEVKPARPNPKWESG